MTEKSGECWICKKYTNKIDLDFETWQHSTCWFPANQRFWSSNLAIDIVLHDGVAVLL